MHPPVCRLAWVQEVIVSAAIVAAGAGSAVGGALSDALGRRRALLLSDTLFTLGALCMGAAWSAGVLIAGEWLTRCTWLQLTVTCPTVEFTVSAPCFAGRALVGLGVGLASVTVPVYIAECAPPGVRASLVTVNVFLITGWWNSTSAHGRGRPDLKRQWRRRRCASSLIPPHPSCSCCF